MKYLTKEKRNARLKARMILLEMGPGELMKRYGANKTAFDSFLRADEWQRETVRKFSEALWVEDDYFIAEDRDENGDSIQGGGDERV